MTSNCISQIVSSSLFVILEQNAKMAGQIKAFCYLEHKQLHCGITLIRCGAVAKLDGKVYFHFRQILTVD